MNATQLEVGQTYKLSGRALPTDLQMVIDLFNLKFRLEAHNSETGVVIFGGKDAGVIFATSTNDIATGRLIVVNVVDSLPPQSRKVYDLLKSGQSLTSRTALIDYGVMSLSRRICDLKDVGIEVNSVMERNKFTKQRFARYSLAA